MGCGILSGQIIDGMPDDMRRILARSQQSDSEGNMILVKKLENLARKLKLYFSFK